MVTEALTEVPFSLNAHLESNPFLLVVRLCRCLDVRYPIEDQCIWGTPANAVRAIFVFQCLSELLHHRAASLELRNVSKYLTHVRHLFVRKCGLKHKRALTWFCASDEVVHLFHR